MLQQIWNGLTVGSLYGLIGLGYSLIFGVLQVIFFAQGELSMLAAFAALAVLAWLGSSVPPALAILAAAIAALAASLVAGLGAERLALRPLRSAPKVMPLITSLGASIVFQNLILVSAGPQPRPFRFPVDFGSGEAFGVRYQILEIWLLAALFLSAAAIRYVLKTRRIGLTIRAVAQSEEGAQLMGIQPDRAIRGAFAISSTTAALAGVLMALYYGIVRFDMGFVPGIKGFTVAIVGGVGNIWGAVLAGLALGVAESLFAGYVSTDYRDFLVFGILVLTLLVRPRGLLGQGD